MIAASSWLVASLLGLGVFPFLLLTGSEGRRTALMPGNRLRDMTLALMLGLLTDHAIGLLTGSLAVQHAFAWIGIGGLILGGVLLARRWGHTAPRGFDIVAVALTLLVLTLMALAIFGQPILAWDARSIWFFHAKAIFFDGGVHSSAFWQNPSYNWSHKGYPQMVPLLAARAADFVLGDWNEFAPKAALVPLAFSGLFGLLTAGGGLMAFMLLAAGAIVILGDGWWTGYMDGWVALHATVAILALAIWSRSGDRRDLALAAAALGITLCLKDEGQLLVLVVLAVLALVIRAGRRLRAGDAAVLTALVPFLAWTWLKPRLPAEGALESGGLLRRAVAVIADPPELLSRLAFLGHTAVAKTQLVPVLVAYLLLGGLLGFGRTAALCGIAALIYSLGIVGVYLGTPFPFIWHVETSLDRVAMVPSVLLLAGLASMLPGLVAACRGESRQATQQPVSG